MGIMSAMTASAAYPYRSSYDDRYYRSQEDADRAERAAREAEEAAQDAQESAGEAKASVEYSKGFTAGLAAQQD